MYFSKGTFIALELKTLTHFSDNELFCLISAGDEPAFTEIFKRYDKRIFPFAMKIVKSEMLAEEITQEIFVKLWKNRSRLADIDHPQSYIFTICSNLAMDYIRKQLNQRKLLNKLQLSSGWEGKNFTDDTVIYRDYKSMVDRAVEKLPDRQKQVYHLNIRQGMNHEEIASLLHLSPYTVRNHLAEAQRSIRQFLSHEEGYHILLLVFFLSQKNL